MDRKVFLASAYALNAAVKKMRPDAKLVGVLVDDRGFYCDFVTKPFTREDLDKLESILNTLARKEIEVQEMGFEDSMNLIGNEEYALKRIQDQNKVKIVKIAGEHMLYDGESVHEFPGFVKLLNASSALFKPLQLETVRIMGVGFETKSELEKYIKEMEEAEKRDHKRIGRQLGWYVFSELTGPGMPLFAPGGDIIRKELVKLVREKNNELNFTEVWTPHIYKTDLWKISGHYEAYLENMYVFELDGQEYGVKPMSCPAHVQIYKSKPKSYKELPIKYAEFATVYRKEQSGELQGLLRVSSITQDDHHVFARKDQIKQVIKEMLKAEVETMNVFGFEVKFNLSTKPEKHIGDDEIWEIATNALKESLEEEGVQYQIKEGEGAFYGPKIDLDAKDALGRWWQLGTIQLDFNMPMRFEMEYVGDDDKLHTPVMIHWATLGSIERFMGIVIENFAGKLPTWLHPIQVVVLPVSEKQKGYAEQVVSELKSKDIRAEMRWDGTLGKRIRDARNDRVPNIVVVGDREVEEGKITVTDRKESNKELNKSEFVEWVLRKIKNRELDV